MANNKIWFSQGSQKSVRQKFEQYGEWRVGGLYEAEHIPPVSDFGHCDTEYSSKYKFIRYNWSLCYCFVVCGVIKVPDVTGSWDEGIQEANWGEGSDDSPGQGYDGERCKDPFSRDCYYIMLIYAVRGDRKGGY